ncbi:MAG TPA: hypothetical protein DCZ11_11825, partial [Gammaproteobacteria bacterium]|nr:hypothetical protein [Gammaproteobacteria bacterium]MCH79118.1 hypothetical protein [Gammaproteobacteria bacterium]
MATARDYAEWIVANKDKKGTPEFEKVSQAYALAKAKGAITAPLGPDSQAANIVRATGSGVADIVGWPIDMGTKALQA